MSLFCSDTYCEYVHDYSVDANVIRDQLNGMLSDDVLEIARCYSNENFCYIETEMTGIFCHPYFKDM